MWQQNRTRHIPRHARRRSETMSKAGQKELQRRALDQANLERRVRNEVGLSGTKPPNSSGPKPPSIAAPALPATAPTPSRVGGRKAKPTATIAPPGECVYCDNRRANIAASVIKHRKAKRRDKARKAKEAKP
jgi:hypothetical protein